MVMITVILQVLQYEIESGHWSKIDQKLERGRLGSHAIAEVNLRDVCFGIGNLNLI